MTWGRLFAGLLCGVLCEPAQAQLLRSGEHGDYTRLAFTFPDRIEWSVSETGTEFDISFEPTPEFDLSAVYQRIDRSRLGAVSFAEGALTLDLACACGISVQRVGADQIAIDISPRTTQEEITATVPEADPPQRPDTGSEQNGGLEPTLPLLLEPLTAQLGPRLTRAERESLIGPVRSPNIEAEVADNPPQVALRDGRAADVRRQNPVLMETPVAENTCGGSNRLRGMLERSPSESRDQLPDMVAAFDADKPETIRDLVDTYFAAGLSTEARHVARAHDVNDTWDALLYAASGEAFPDLVVPVNTECGAAAALLALATGGTATTLPATLMQEILSLAQTLPEERRQTLVRRGAEQARRAGYSGFADELAAWALERERDDPPSALEEYGAALADQMEDATENGALPLPSLLAESEAILRELPDAEDRHTIHNALLQDAAARGDLAESQEALAQITPSYRWVSLAQVATMIAGQSPERAVVLATALMPLRAEMAAADRAKIAETVDGAGFATLAQRWYQPSSDRITVTAVEQNSASDPPPRVPTPASEGGTQGQRAATVSQSTPRLEAGTIEGAEARLASSRDIAEQVADLLARAPSLN